MWESVFACLAIGAGFLGAALWLVASRVRVLKRAADITPAEHSIWLFTDDPEVREQPFLSAQRQGRWNAWAAGVTAGAVLLQAISLAAHQFKA